MEIKKIKEKLIQDIERLRAPEGYVRAGSPRFFTLFGRDSLITAWQLLDYDKNIAKNTLKILSDFQGVKIDNEHEEEPGKILHEWWGDVSTKVPDQKPEIPWPFPYYGSIDSTFLYLILASLYFKKTHDKEFIFSIKKNILSAIRWIFDYGDKNGDNLIDFERRNPRGIYFQGWRDSSCDEDDNAIPPIALVEVQGYAFMACEAAREIIDLYGEKSIKKELKNKARELKTEFLKSFWWKEEKYFYFEIGNFRKPTKVVTSNPGHLLFTGILPKGRADFVVKRLFEKDMWTPYGIRTQSSLSSDFDPTKYHKGSIWPHDNWIIAEGLKKTGHNNKYFLIKKALLEAYDKLGKIPELYSVNEKNELIPPLESNDLQAWSSAGLLNMILSD